jgi:hypothetical protein
MPDTSSCLNCFEALPPHEARFCPHCGQETNPRPPTIGEFIQQFGGAFVSTEGALWRTLKVLLLAPGELTRRYLAGQRRHFVLPLRLYLTTSVIVLLLVRGASLLGLEPVTVNANFDRPKQLNLELGVGRAGLRDGTFFCEDLPAWLCHRLELRLDTDPKRLSYEAGRIGDRLIANLGVAMFVLLPIFAALTFVAWLNRRLRYTEHLVFALHVHAFWFVAIALTLPGIGWLSVLAFAAIPVYTLLAMRRVFGGRLAPRLLRALFVSLLYTAALALALLGAGLVALLG